MARAPSLGKPPPPSVKSPGAWSPGLPQVTGTSPPCKLPLSSAPGQCSQGQRTNRPHQRHRIIELNFYWRMGFPGGSVVKNPPANGLTPGQETSLEEEMTTHSSILAWKIPCSLAGYSLWGHKESDMTEWLSMTERIHQKSKGSDSISIFHGLLVEPVCPCSIHSFLDGEALLQGPCHLQHVPSALAWNQSPVYCITYRRVPLGRASEEWAGPSFS